MRPFYWDYSCNKMQLNHRALKQEVIDNQAADKYCNPAISMVFSLVYDLRRLGSFETKSLDLRNIFCRSYLVNTR